jgi:hypothetical protein
MTASNYLEGKLYDATLKNTTYTAGASVYLSLHTADPAETGANEVAGAGYSRQACAFGVHSGGSGSNSGTVTVPLPSSGGPFAVTHIALWDASSGGNCLLEGALTGTINAAAGDSIQFTAGQITATFT